MKHPTAVDHQLDILGLHSNDQLVNADSRIAYEGMCGADYSITRHGPSFFICLPGLSALTLCQPIGL